MLFRMVVLVSLLAPALIPGAQAAAPTGAPDALAPGTSSGPGTEVQTLTPRLTWTSVAGATNYRVYARLDPPNGPLVLDQGYVYATDFTIPSGILVAGANYRWNVRAYNADGPGPISDTLYFRTGTVPAAPQAQGIGSTSEPAAPTVSGSFTLRWDAVANAQTYDVAVSRHPYGPSNIVRSFEGVSGTSVTLDASELTAGASFRWDVAARNGMGAGPRSSDLYFRTAAPPPPPEPSPPAPSPAPTPAPATRLPAPGAPSPGADHEGNAAGLSGVVTLRWDPVPGASTYDLAISRRPYGIENVLHRQPGLTGTSATVDLAQLPAEDLYRWDVAAVDASGVEGARSSDRYFRTPPAPAAPGGSGVVERACSEESSTRSTHGTTGTSVTFQNPTTTPIRLYWLDYQGARVLYATIPAGSQLVQPTYATHPWLLVGEGGDCRGLYVATSEAGRVSARERPATTTPAPTPPPTTPRPPTPPTSAPVVRVTTTVEPFATIGKQTLFVASVQLVEGHADTIVVQIDLPSISSPSLVEFSRVMYERDVVADTLAGHVRLRVTQAWQGRPVEVLFGVTPDHLGDLDVRVTAHAEGSSGRSAPVPSSGTTRVRAAALSPQDFLGGRPILDVAVSDVATSDTNALFKLHLDTRTEDLAFPRDASGRPTGLAYVVNELRIETAPGQKVQNVVVIPRGEQHGLLATLGPAVSAATICKGIHMMVDVAGIACEATFAYADIVEEDASGRAQDARLPVAGGVILQDAVLPPGLSIDVLVWMTRPAGSDKDWTATTHLDGGYRAHANGADGVRRLYGETWNVRNSYTLRDDRPIQVDPGAVPSFETPLALPGHTERAGLPQVSVQPLALSDKLAYMTVRTAYPPLPERSGRAAILGTGAAAVGSEIDSVVVAGGARVVHAVPLGSWEMSNPDQRPLWATVGTKLGCHVIGYATFFLAGAACDAIMTFKIDEYKAAGVEAENRLVAGGVIARDIKVKDVSWTIIEHLVVLERPSGGASMPVWVQTDFTDQFEVDVPRSSEVCADQWNRLRPRIASSTLAKFVISDAGARLEFDTADRDPMLGSPDWGMRGLDGEKAAAGARALADRRAGLASCQAGHLLVNVRSPVDLLIEDGEGRAVGIRDGIRVNEIPGATQILLGHEEAYLLPEGAEYRYTAVGTGEGTYTLHLTRTRADGSAQGIFVGNLSTAPGLTDRFVPTPDWTGFEVAPDPRAANRKAEAGVAGAQIGTPAYAGSQVVDLAGEQRVTLVFAPERARHAENPTDRTPEGASLFVSASTFRTRGAPAEFHLAPVETLDAAGTGASVYRLAPDGRWTRFDTSRALLLGPDEAATLALFAPTPARLATVNAEVLEGARRMRIVLSNAGEAGGDIEIVARDAAGTLFEGIVSVNSSGRHEVELPLERPPSGHAVRLFVDGREDIIFSSAPRVASPSATTPIPDVGLLAGCLAVLLAGRLLRRR